MIKIITFFALAMIVSRPVIAVEDEAETPLSIDVCDLLSNPHQYHHKLVRVSGSVSRGFEDFTLGGEACSERLTIWLEYGGPKPADVVCACVKARQNPPNGKDPLYVDGIATSLVRDSTFRAFDRSTRQLRRGRSVQAVLIGRVFAAGDLLTEDEETLVFGFGHMAAFSLLVIQKVENVR